MSTREEAQAAAERGVTEAISALNAAGAKVSVSPEMIQAIGAGVIATVEMLSNAAVKKAIAAGVDAASKVTTVEQANAVMEAAAASQEKP